MKKIFLYGLLLIVICFTAGCGNSGTEERLKTGEERALELKDDAEDAVDKVNENTNRLNQDAENFDKE